LRSDFLAHRSLNHDRRVQRAQNGPSERASTETPGSIATFTHEATAVHKEFIEEYVAKLPRQGFMFNLQV
jgi:hypothetical protein